MSPTAAFLIWLLCVGISAIIIGYFIKYDLFTLPLAQPEGFRPMSTIRMHSCPPTTVPYTTSAGDTNCCSGDIVNSKCHGTDACSLSPSIPGGLQSCSDWMQKEWRARSDRFCTDAIPYYYGTMTRTGSSEGCSASQCTEDGSAPEDRMQKICKIYGTQADDLAKIDSCGNARAMEAMQCPLSSAGKTILPTGISNNQALPALLKCTYTPPGASSSASSGSSLSSISSGSLPVECWDFPRAKTFIGKIVETWNWDKDFVARVNAELRRIEPIDVIFCPASKAYYIDKTLTAENAIGLPSTNAGGSNSSCNK